MSMGIGIIGCGNISGIYLQNFSSRFPGVRLVACADLQVERARTQGVKFGILALGVDELLSREDIGLVVNLTVPLSHAEVSMRILQAGKHVYSEKPLAATRADGQRILELAAARGLRVGGAPDTFLGAGIQTCRRLVAEGVIGEVVGGSANMLCPGHESWHPDPGFYYRHGGGPVLDMGPYYLSALVEIIGPMAGVSASSRVVRTLRTVGSGPKKGETIAVEVATHVAGLLRFAAGPLVSLTMSFEVQSHRLPFIELWGTEGSLAVPDPNCFGGPVLLCRRGEHAWSEQALEGGPEDNARGVGAAEMADSIDANQPARASGIRCFHVLDAMEGLHDAAASLREQDLAVSGQALAGELLEMARQE